jgi:hypothetical protein
VMAKTALSGNSPRIGGFCFDVTNRVTGTAARCEILV